MSQTPPQQKLRTLLPKEIHRSPDGIPNLPGINPEFFRYREGSCPPDSKFIHFGTDQGLRPYEINPGDYQPRPRSPEPQPQPQPFKMSNKPEIVFEEPHFNNLTKIKDISTIVCDKNNKKCTKHFTEFQRNVDDFIAKHSDECSKTPRHFNKGPYKDLAVKLADKTKMAKEAFSKNRPGFDADKHLAWPEDREAIIFISFALLKIQSSKFFAKKRKNGDTAAEDEGPSKKVKPDEESDLEEEEASEAEDEPGSPASEDGSTDFFSERRKAVGAASPTPSGVERKSAAETLDTSDPIFTMGDEDEDQSNEPEPGKSGPKQKGILGPDAVQRSVKIAENKCREKKGLPVQHDIEDDQSVELGDKLLAGGSRPGGSWANLGRPIRRESSMTTMSDVYRQNVEFEIMFEVLIFSGPSKPVQNGFPSGTADANHVRSFTPANRSSPPTNLLSSPLTPRGTHSSPPSIYGGPLPTNKPWSVTIACKSADSFQTFYGQVALAIKDSEILLRLHAAESCIIKVPQPDGKEHRKFNISHKNGASVSSMWRHHMTQACRSVGTGMPQEGETVIVEFH